MAEEEKAATTGGSDGKKIGVVAATLMVAGNMMGSGVFMLPANLATIGGISIFGWVVTCIGAIALAMSFAKLANIDPASGGPYAYTRKAFGPYMGYQTNLIYWLANVVGNVGLAVVGLGYLSGFFPMLKNLYVFAACQIAVIWLFTYANILGPRLVSKIQGVTTSIALVPIILTAIVGWFWFSPQTYMDAWNVTGKSDVSAVGATLNFTLWAFIGVESASVGAGVVENPRKNVPIATIGGVILAAVCYVLSSSVIMGMIPNKALIASAAPFADAAKIAFGPLAGHIVAACAALGCLGSLAGWTLLVGQSAKAAADDGLFPNVFAKLNANGVPSSGLAIVAAFMTVQVLCTMSPSASAQFGKIASIAVIMTLLPYIYSCISVYVLGYGKLEPKEYSKATFIALLGGIYSMAALIGSDGEQTRWSLVFVISTIVFYTTAIKHQHQIENGEVVGGQAPRWIRYLTMAITIVTLCIAFMLSVGGTSKLNLHHRSNNTPTTTSVQQVEPGGTATQHAPAAAN
jgi:arginine:agmatine antiporter